MSGYRESEQTKLRIKEAFLDHCIEHNSVPNVKHLCSEIGIDRGTFYNHFNSIHNLAECLMQELFEKNERYRSVSYSVSFEMIYNLLKICIQDRKTILVLLNPALILPFRTEIRTLVYNVVLELLSFRSVREKKYVAGFIADGILSITYSWLKEQDITYEEFANILFELIFRAIPST